MARELVSETNGSESVGVSTVYVKSSVKEELMDTDGLVTDPDWLSDLDLSRDSVSVGDPCVSESDGEARVSEIRELNVCGDGLRVDDSESVARSRDSDRVGLVQNESVADALNEAVFV